MLETLLTSLKANDARANEELLKLIQSGATTVEIAQHALDMSKRSGISSKRAKPYVMDIVALTDQPLFSMPAQPWTEITEDDSDVSHLLSIYLTWQQHCYPVFDQEILIRELTARQVSSRYCSQFLVNALLALACVRGTWPLLCLTTDHYRTDVHRSSSSLRRSSQPCVERTTLLPRCLATLAA